MMEAKELPNPRNRRSNQRYVMYFLESPLNYKYDYGKFDDFFNWTMTYRLDSDIPFPYGRVVQKFAQFSYVSNSQEIGSWALTYDYEKFAASFNSTRSKEFHALAHRPMAVAWIVSNCVTGSHRESYVSELSKYIQVDIYGQCTKRSCGNYQDCLEFIEQNYMFYLAFENSFCEDYVTEKLWQWLRKDIVPVVMGQANYSAISPPHSVINVMNYPDPKNLAKYLLKLMENETEYLSYLWWKEFYKVDNNPTFAPMCKLCQMLNAEEKLPKMRGRLKEWWSKEGHCMSKRSFPWSKYKSVFT